MALKKKEITEVVNKETSQQTNTSSNQELLMLETKKVKALEKIANSLDALTIWFEEIDKEDWSERVQYYLSEFHKLVPKEKE
jgi:spore germination protein YaaH